MSKKEEKDNFIIKRDLQKGNVEITVRKDKLKCDEFNKYVYRGIRPKGNVVYVYDIKYEGVCSNSAKISS